MFKSVNLARIGIFLLLLVSLVAVTAQAVAQEAAEDPRMVALGKAIFFDPNLSVNRTQSCASCHAPDAGFTGPDSLVNDAGSIYEGAIITRYGNRKPPTSSYGGDSPILFYDETKQRWFGGMFWDGRATGWALGDPLAEQAQGPFLNPLEQAMPNARSVVARVAESEYAYLFEEVWGPGSLDFANDVAGSYERIARSVAAYERGAEANPFTSRFDLFWDNAVAAGRNVTKIRWSGGGGGMGGGGMTDPYRWQNYRGLGLSDAELQGLAAFNDPNRGDCASCHTLTPGSEGYPLFTDFGYDNLGIPKNPENPYYDMPHKWNRDGAEWIDPGLGGFLQAAGQTEEVYAQEMGKFKVPTLRNVDLRPSDDFVKAYGHNGYFKSLWDIVFFYHWRGMIDAGCPGGMDGGGDMGGGGMGGGMMCEAMATMFPPPELDENRAVLPVFPRMDVDRITLFLETLSDGYIER